MPVKVEGKPFCWRKVMYSYDAAVLAWRSLHGHRRPDATMNIYHCPECGAYHIGHNRRAAGSQGTDAP